MNGFNAHRLLLLAERDQLVRAGVATVLIVATVLLMAVTAHAAPRHIDCDRQGCHETHYAAPVRHHTRHYDASLCHPETAAGTITVACNISERMTGFINDVVARGFRGPVHCYARGGHVRHSLHYSGHACDFAQRGWGKTVPVMRRVADLAAKWGLRDGCTFRDCGHIDSGRAVRTRVAHARVLQRTARR